MHELLLAVAFIQQTQLSQQEWVLTVDDVQQRGGSAVGGMRA
jgi:adenine/guanine phosphoribosyltransferase-like PRPP-binding protein